MTKQTYQKEGEEVCLECGKMIGHEEGCQLGISEQQDREEAERILPSEY